jgi:hypothetical protein
VKLPPALKVLVSFPVNETLRKENFWRNGTSFALNDLEALMNVAFEAKKWMTAHTLKC